jgi:hypothetical protein
LCQRPLVRLLLSLVCVLPRGDPLRLGILPAFYGLIALLSIGPVWR